MCPSAYCGLIANLDCDKKSCQCEPLFTWNQNQETCDCNSPYVLSGSECGKLYICEYFVNIAYNIFTHSEVGWLKASCSTSYPVVQCSSGSLCLEGTCQCYPPLLPDPSYNYCGTVFFSFVCIS